MAEGDEKYDVHVAEVKPKEKRKRLTAEEKLMAAEEKIRAAAAKAEERARATQAKKNAKKAADRATRNTAKKALRDQLFAAVMNRAADNQLSFKAEHVKIPAVAANNVDKYYQAAKKRYYAKHPTKKSSIHRLAIDAAQEQGIPEQYVKKTTRNKTVNAMIAAAKKRYNKNTEKRDKTGRRAAIMSMIQEKFSLNETDAMKVICVRKKK